MPSCDMTAHELVLSQIPRCDVRTGLEKCDKQLLTNPVVARAMENFAENADYLVGVLARKWKTTKAAAIARLLDVYADAAAAPMRSDIEHMATRKPINDLWMLRIRLYAARRIAAWHAWLVECEQSAAGVSEGPIAADPGCEAGSSPPAVRWPMDLSELG